MPLEEGSQCRLWQIADRWLKCNQAKDKACNNCSRRYPPVPCVYETFRWVNPICKFATKILISTRKGAKHKGSTVELKGPEPKIEEVETSLPRTPFLGPLHEETDFQGSIASPKNRHPIWQIPIRSPSNWQEGYRDLGKDGKPPDPNDEVFYSLPVTDISSHFRTGRFCAYPQLFHPQYVDPKVPVGGVDTNPLVSLPIEPSRKNAELYHFCK